ncbi:hypothetical protein JW865_03360 [Candidatus Bathyarchaeota archaeon]|nr:hypothetical protein [Candidatus Bathyarchaeota archaeon]
MNEKLREWIKYQSIFILIYFCICGTFSTETKGFNPYIDETYYEDLWTLLIQVHCPYYGITDGSVSKSWSTIFTVGEIGCISTITHTYGIIPSQGRCKGWFQVCRWVYEKWRDYGDPNWEEERWYIFSEGEGYTLKNIYGDSQYTCVDDITSFTYAGYDSLEINTRYVSMYKWIWADPYDSGYINCDVDNNNYFGLNILGKVNILGLESDLTFILKNFYNSSLLLFILYYFSFFFFKI